jgi:hypothetical protein
MTREFEGHLNPEESAEQEGFSAWRSRLPETPDEVAKHFGIPDEDRDNPLTQDFLQRYTRTGLPSPEQPERQPYRPSTPLSPEQSARQLRIPEANRDNPVVQEFTSVHSRLDRLINDTLRARTDHDRPAKGQTLATQREVFAAPDMAIPLDRRYEVANALLLAAQQFLTEGMNDGYDPRPYAFRQITAAVSRLGYDLRLEKKPPTIYNFDDDIEPIDPPEPPLFRKRPLPEEVDIDE